jgi:hypothetical protein
MRSSTLQAAKETDNMIDLEGTNVVEQSVA